ncbi:MAG: hypothetical protein ACREFL_17770 [Stellaceae bacterium]
MSASYRACLRAITGVEPRSADGAPARNVALPISAFSWDAQAGSFKIARTGDELKSMPEWHEQVSEAPGGTSNTATRMLSGGASNG